MQNTLSTWQTVFWISAAVYIAGAIIYTIMATGTEQPWAKADYKQTDKSNINGNYQHDEGI